MSYTEVLNNKSVEHVAEFAAAGYYGSKLAKGDVDPYNSKGRIGGSVNVRNHADYAATAGGQMVVGHFAFIIYWHLFMVWVVATGFGTVELLNAVHAGSTATLVAFGIWAIAVVFYLGLYKPIKWLYKHGPSITYADGYKGPLGNAETVYTPRYIYVTPQRPIKVQSHATFRQGQSQVVRPTPQQLRQGQVR